MSLGNTWQLVPLVIAAILTLAVVANALVAWLGSVPLLAAYGVLLGGLAVEALANLTGRFADVGALQLLVRSVHCSSRRWCSRRACAGTATSPAASTPT